MGFAVASGRTAEPSMKPRCARSMGSTSIRTLDQTSGGPRGRTSNGRNCGAGRTTRVVVGTLIGATDKRDNNAAVSTGLCDINVQ